MASITRRVGESRRVPRTLKLELYLVHAARNISGQHEKEIDALGSASGRPTCHRYQPEDRQGSQNAHYVATVLLWCKRQRSSSSFFSQIKIKSQ